jgi:aminoglycoside phosphotransferase (APT) family kinase protein
MSNVIRSDPAAVTEALRPWLAERIPDADEIELPRVREPETGGSSETFFLDPVIRRGAGRTPEKWVLRLEATGFQVYQDPSVEKQYRVMETLARTGEAPVPEVLWYEPDPRVLGAPFFLMRHVEGVLPHQMEHSQGLFMEIPPAEREAIWLAGVETLARINLADPSNFDFLWRPDLGPTGLDQEIAAWDEYDRWCGAPTRPVQTRALRWLHDHAPAERPTGLAWGDARLGNMIFRDNVCRAAIDWETVSLGGAEMDLAWWNFNEWLYTDGFGIPPLEGVGDADATIAAWERFAGRKAQAMHWHDVFATWRFSRIVDRHICLMGEVTGDEAVMASDENPIMRRLERLLAE